MRNLLALLLFVPSLCLAQVPDYVPLDGLVGWYPFNGNTENVAGEDGTLATTSTDWTMDRDGIDSSAIAFTALNSYAFGSLPADFQNNHYSYALWWRIDGAYNYNGYNLLTYPSSSPGNLDDNALAYTIDENWYYLNCPDATSGYTSSARIGYDHTLRALDCAVLEDMEQWNHSVVTVDGTMMKLYFNGTFIDSVSVDLDMSDYLGETLVLGARNNPAQNSLTTRILDEVGIWNRALSEAEIQALFTAEPPPSIPDYVPTDGLVAWYPFNGNALDESGNGFDCQSVGATLTEDRFGSPSSAYAFDGQGSHLQGSSLPFSDLSISLWFKAEAGVFDTYSGGTPPIGAQLIGQGTTHNPCRYCDWAIGISDWSEGVDNLAWEKANSSPCQVQQTASNWEPELGEWTHLAAVSEGTDVSFYINGNWVSTIPFDQPFQQGGSILSIGSRYVENCNGGGSCTGPDNAWSGSIDDVAVWNRALLTEEINALCGGAPCTPSGCMDPVACNFNPDAQCEGSPCLYNCCPGPGCCADGTVWNIELEQCVGQSSPCDTVFLPIPSCGTGTVWDPVNEECIVAIPADLNYDGCVTVNDLLVLLAVHGTCPPYPEWPEEPTDTTWTCGDPVTYWDYDYATVLIGDQCWFAENCRYLPAVSLPETGSETDGEPHAYVYNFLGTDVDLAKQSPQFLLHGALYNFQAATTWDVCPSGWSVPTGDVIGDLFESTTPNEIASLDFGGSNASGFNAMGDGRRNFDGGFSLLGSDFYLWSRTESVNPAQAQVGIQLIDGTRYEHNNWKSYGHSVRCIKD